MVPSRKLTDRYNQALAAGSYWGEDHSARRNFSAGRTDTRNKEILATNKALNNLLIRAR